MTLQRHPKSSDKNEKHIPHLQNYYKSKPDRHNPTQKRELNFLTMTKEFTPKRYQEPLSPGPLQPKTKRVPNFQLGA